MAKDRQRLWTIPLREVWPRGPLGGYIAVPIYEAGTDDEVGRWLIGDRRTSQVLKEARVIVMQHNVPIREARLKAARQRIKVKALKQQAKKGITHGTQTADIGTDY